MFHIIFEIRGRMITYILTIFYAFSTFIMVLYENKSIFLCDFFEKQKKVEAN